MVAFINKKTITKTIRASFPFLSKKQKTKNKKTVAFLNKKKNTIRESLLFLSKTQKVKIREYLFVLTKKK